MNKTRGRESSVDKFGNVVPAKYFDERMRLVFLIENGSASDAFGLEFAPYDPTEQCIDNLKWSLLHEGGRPVEFNTKSTLHTYTTLAKGYYRIKNFGFDNTRACVSLIDVYKECCCGGY